MSPKTLLCGLFVIFCIVAINADKAVDKQDDGVFDCARHCSEDEITKVECPSGHLTRLNHCSCTEFCLKWRAKTESEQDDAIFDCARACSKEEIKLTECPAGTIKRLNHCSCTEVCDKKTKRFARELESQKDGQQNDGVVECERDCSEEDIKKVECPDGATKQLNYCYCTEYCKKDGKHLLFI
ncbi:hypothetical protein L596_017454 [Steinernema carpocapsae]|uniref:Uncharacterized protein n=1 Tax=Steinernema carpocapsae TaxID=34508 RepID=A0A4V6A1Q3_STECR|nr:hypothetical protein L596_017454 [Steinernema carpocapsae]